MLFDKVIQWGDGSAEHVQIGADGFFRIDGAKKRLVGIDIGTTGFGGTDFFMPGPLATIDKELAYLEAAGVRLIHGVFGYIGMNKEQQSYSGLLDMLYDHKMLVLPLITGKWLPNFDNLTVVDFPIGGEDSLSAHAARWCQVMAGYPNVVAVSVENELDLRLSGQTYTGPAAASYIAYLGSIVKANIDVPTFTKLMAYFPGGEIDAIKAAVAPYVDILAFDLYQPTVPEAIVKIGETIAWLGGQGLSQSGWWLGELNGGTGNAVDAASFLPDYIDVAFDRGVSVALLWQANRTQEPTAAFFDVAGDPIPSMELVANEIGRLQTPVEGGGFPVKGALAVLALLGIIVAANRKR